MSLWPVRVMFADKWEHAGRRGHRATTDSLATSPLHSILPTHHPILQERAYTQLITRLLCFLQSLLANSVNGFHSLGSFTSACLVTHPWHVLQIEPVSVPPSLSFSLSPTRRANKALVIKPWFLYSSFTLCFCANCFSRLNIARDHFKGQIMRLRHIGQSQIKLAYWVSGLSQRSSVSEYWQTGGVTVLWAGILASKYCELTDTRR